MPARLDNLAPEQRVLLRQWLPGMRVVADMSWGLVATTVLLVEHRGIRMVVKAGGANDHHIARELDAHHRWIVPWTTIGRAPSLEFGDVAAKLLVTRYLDGELVDGTPRQRDPEVFRQAGALLAMLHAQAGTTDREHEARVNARALAWLDGPHRIEPRTVERLRSEIAAWPTPPARLVPTHGDWQPRNWLVHGDEVRIIDFGRAAIRPAMTDLARLAVQDFRRDPLLEHAFFDGYGADPRDADEDGWFRIRVREAVGTAAWAHQVEDPTFEAQGLEMIAQVLNER